MEDITDAAFRRMCRGLGASLCMTEFVGAEQIIADSEVARRRAYLSADDRPTAIQIYGADADLLMAAARIGRAAIAHPWIFREAQARLDGRAVAPPTDAERLAMFRLLTEASVAKRGDRAGVAAAKRHIAVLGPLLADLKTRLLRA